MPISGHARFTPNSSRPASCCGGGSKSARKRRSGYGNCGCIGDSCRSRFATRGLIAGHGGQFCRRIVRVQILPIACAPVQKPRTLSALSGHAQFTSRSIAPAPAVRHWPAAGVVPGLPVPGRATGNTGPSVYSQLVRVQFLAHFSAQFLRDSLPPSSDAQRLLWAPRSMRHGFLQFSAMRLSFGKPVGSAASQDTADRRSRRLRMHWP